MAFAMLGDEVRDVVSGFEGVAIGESKWLTGCRQVAVQPCIVKDGKLSDITWFDETRLKVIKKKAVSVSSGENGGPMLTH